MASYVLTKNLLLNGTAQSVAASQTDQVISQVHGITARDANNFAAVFQLSAAKAVSGITIKLQDFNGIEWSNIGTQAQVALAAKTFADADVTDATENIAITGHGFVTGDAVCYYSSATHVVDGLLDGVTYYVIKVDNDNLKLAETKALAIAGTPIDITAPTDGDSHYLTNMTVLQIALNIENSTDEAQLPIYPQIRAVVSTGANDSVTVSQMICTRRRDE